jgi:hypothetical protein
VDEIKALTKEEILEKAEQAQDRLARASAAVAELVGQTQDAPAAGSAGAARAQQEAVAHLKDALSLLKQLTTWPAAEGEFPRCMRCDKPVDRLGLSPRPDNPEVVRVEFECHNEVVRQELSASVVEGGLSRYSAFNAYTSGLMPLNPEERP